MKKKKLSLDALKVKSFVTDSSKGTFNTIKGGNGQPWSQIICDSAEDCQLLTYICERPTNEGCSELNNCSGLEFC